MANTKHVRTNFDCAGTTTLAILNVSGAAAFSGASSFPGGITGGLSVAGNSTFQNNLTVQGDLSVTGSFSFSGGAVFPADTFQVQDPIDPSKYVNFDVSAAATGFKTTIAASQTADRVISLPDATTSLVGHNTVQTLTNKTIDASSNVISNIIDANISAAAQIAMTKLATITASRVAVSDPSGYIVPASVTTTELGLLSGLTAALVTISDTQTLTNKVIDADANSISNIADANVKSGAAIARNKLANGSADHVVINSSGGVMTSEAQLAPVRGGTGQDMSASSGIIRVTAGVFSASSIVNADVNAAAAIARSKLASGTANYVLVNDGSGVMAEVSKLNESQGGTNQSTYAVGDILYASATNTLSKLSVGSAGDHLTVSNSGVPSWERPGDLSKVISLNDDFMGALAGDTLAWQSWSGGGTAAITNVSTNITNTHPGIIRLSTGTTAGIGRAGLGLAPSATTMANGVVLGTNDMTIEYLIFLGQLSTVSDEFILSVGLHQSSTATQQTNGVTMKYDRLNYGTDWQCETNSASSTTRTGSGVAAAASAWVKLTIVANATSVKFYINGSLVATHSTNIPTVCVTPGFKIDKSAGTTNTYFDIDYFTLYKRFSTAR